MKKRLRKEMQEYLHQREPRSPRDPLPLFEFPEAEDIANGRFVESPHKLRVLFFGQPSTIYEGGVWEARYEFKDYPFTAPRLYLLTPMFCYNGSCHQKPVQPGQRIHPVCHGYIEHSLWSPINSLCEASTQVWLHLTNPEDEPHWSNLSLRKLFQENRSDYERRARVHTLRHARPIARATLFQLLLPIVSSNLA